MRLHFQAQGEGRPLIILHGFLGSLDNWRWMSRRLAQHSKVYTLDLRNHGRSPHTAVMNYPAMAEDLHDFIRAHGLAEPSVMGHSMGGKVAMQFAVRYPAKVSGLVVVDIAPKAYPPAHRTLLAAMRAVNLKNFKSFADVDHALADAIPDAVIRQFLLKNLDHGGAQALRWRIGLDEIMENYDELTKAVIIDTPFVKPACFIRGGRSDFVQDEDLAPVREAFPHAEFRTVATAAHWIHIDAPDEFFTIVTDFLTSISGEHA